MTLFGNAVSLSEMCGILSGCVAVLMILYSTMRK